MANHTPSLAKGKCGMSYQRASRPANGIYLIEDDEVEGAVDSALFLLLFGFGKKLPVDKVDRRRERMSSRHRHEVNVSSGFKNHLG